MPKPEPVRSLTAADVDRKFSDALPGVATIIHEVRPLSSNLFAPTFTLIELAFAELAPHALHMGTLMQRRLELACKSSNSILSHELRK